MERPKLLRPDIYHVAEPPWLPPALMPLSLAAPIMWRSRAMPIVDLWFIARVPWKLLLPVRLASALKHPTCDCTCRGQPVCWRRSANLMTPL